MVYLINCVHMLILQSTYVFSQVHGTKIFT